MSHSHSNRDHRSPSTSILANLIRLMITITANLDPVDGISSRVARCVAEELGDMISDSSDHYTLLFRDTLISATTRLCLGGIAGPSLLDSSAALFELAQILYSIPQAPPPDFSTIPRYQSGPPLPPRGSYDQHSMPMQPIPPSRISISASHSPTLTSTSRQSPVIQDQPSRKSSSVQGQSIPKVLNQTRPNHPPSIYLESKQNAPSRPLSIGQPIPNPYIPTKARAASPRSNSQISSVSTGPHSGRQTQPFSSPQSTSSNSRNTSTPTLTRSYFSNLPAEVLELIVLYCQSSNYSSRLQQNLALCLVSRSLDKVARRKLRQEMHITEPFQLEKLDVLARLNPTRMSEVQFLSIDLNIDDLRWKRGTLWYGNYFQFVVRSFAGSIERVSIKLKDSREPFSDRAKALTEATGGTIPIFDQFPNVKELRIYFKVAEADIRKMLASPLVDIRALYIESIQEAEAISATRRGGGEVNGNGKIVSKEEEVEVYITPHPWEVLSLPGIALSPKALFNSFSVTVSKLRHLECFLRIPYNNEELVDYNQLFNTLAPTLSHLSLQLIGSPSIAPTTPTGLTIPDAIWIEFSRHFSRLVNLRTLSISIHSIESNSASTLLTALSTLPELTSLKLLSFLSPTKSALDLSEDLIEILTGTGGDVVASFPELKYLGVLLPGGKDTIGCEALNMLCLLRSIELQAIN